MIVKCPNCLVRYKVNLSRISKTIVQVQCPACEKKIAIDLKRAAQQSSNTDSLERKSLEAKDVLSHASIQWISEALSSERDPARMEALVLIADEPRAFRTFLEKALEELGCRILIADDGNIAETLMRQHKPDLVFMNVVLKKMMGYVLCEKIKNDPVLKDTSVILVGAIFRTDRFRRNPADLYGADDYIEEIIVKQDLQERVRKLLGRTKPAKSDVVTSDRSAYAARLARIILSDLIMYNQTRVNKAIRQGTFFEDLDGEIREGEAFFLSKLASDAQGAREIYRRTIDEYVERRTTELKVEG